MLNIEELLQLSNCLILVESRRVECVGFVGLEVLRTMVDRSIERVNERLNRTIARNTLLQQTTDHIRHELQISRVALYYFYRQWKGQVIAESLSHSHLSILGSTGADECFNHEYADLYLQGRILRVTDIELADFESCHLEFLRSIQVRSEIVVPIILYCHLWGFLAAHHTEIRAWSDQDVALMIGQRDMLLESSLLLDPLEE